MCTYTSAHVLVTRLDMQALSGLVTTLKEYFSYKVTNYLQKCIPKKMKKAVLLADPKPLRPCWVRLEINSTLPRLSSLITSYTSSS